MNNHRELLSYFNLTELPFTKEIAVEQRSNSTCCPPSNASSPPLSCWSTPVASAPSPAGAACCASCNTACPPD